MDSRNEVAARIEIFQLSVEESLTPWVCLIQLTEWLAGALNVTGS